jgi:hypothetical protein
VTKIGDGRWAGGFLIVAGITDATSGSQCRGKVVIDVRRRRHNVHDGGLFRRLKIVEDDHDCLVRGDLCGWRRVGGGRGMENQGRRGRGLTINTRHEKK